MTPKFEIGELVLYQPRPQSDVHVRAIIKGRSCAKAKADHHTTRRFYYSIQRLDNDATNQTHHVPESHLSPVPKRQFPNGECHHAAL